MPFKKKLHTQIEIQASAAKVWDTLMDFQNYPQWSAFVESIEGQPALHAPLRVHLDGMRFTPRVIVFEPQAHFAWLGKLLLPGLFDGAHHFELERIGPDKCRLIQYEHFKGLLVPLFGAILKKVPGQFAAFNQAIKAQAEKC